jgi:hypothetical protein
MFSSFSAFGVLQQLQNLHPSPSIIRNDQVKEDELGRTCSKLGKKGIVLWWANQKERGN